MRGERAWGDSRASGVHGEGPTQGCGGARARAERTSNMRYVSWTLDMSKLSAWLNADAPCQVERRACDAGSGIRPGRREGAGWRRRKRHTRGWPDSRLGGQGTRGAHVEHAVHVRDLGRVEAERLVKRVRALPSQRVGMQCGKRCGPGGVRVLGGGDACGMHGEGPTQGCGGQGTCAERTWNMKLMVVTLDV